MRPLILMMAVCLCACGADFEPGSQIVKLRLLGLRADQPFARPGERIHLRALAIDPEGRALQWAYATCSDPRSTSVEACVANLDSAFMPLPDFAADGGFALDVPQDALSRLSKDARDHAVIGVAVVACPGTIARGHTAGIPVVCRDDGGDALPISEFEVGVKRIFVRAQDRNHNPVIDRIRWDGRTWPEGERRSAHACNEHTHDIEDCAKDLRHHLEVSVHAAEQGEDEHGNRFSEQLIVQVYATNGVFDHDVRIAGEADFDWSALRGADSGVARLVVMVRDDRGGMAWSEREVEIGEK